MLILFLAAALGTAPSAVDAERAFSRDAERSGQWAAFRTYADADAVIFTPRAVWARDFLRGRKDAAKGISWSPTESYVSCDGRMAVNTGSWLDHKAGQSGFFTTVWEHEKGQWHWLSHGRHTLKAPLAATGLAVRQGSCRGRAPGPPLIGPPPIKKGSAAKPDDFGRGYSADRTLGWEWRVGPNGARHFRTYLWTGQRYTLALEQTIGGEWGQ
jgi:hypothetical protein